MNKKEAIKEFKNRKLARGIFIARCTATGEAWVDSSRDLSSAKNSTWFQLRSGGHRNHAMQAAWNQHGEPSFEFEIVETLDEDYPEMGVNDELKNRKQHWATELNAGKMH